MGLRWVMRECDTSISIRRTAHFSSGITFKFQVIDDPDTVNAMALPGGWVYIYSGLLLVSDTEAEVAAVLGHEVAHVTRRHIAERLVTIYGIDALQQVVANQGGGALTSIISDVAANGYLLKYSRDHETDADLTGLTYLIRAGYDPNGFISFFKKLEGLLGLNVMNVSRT